MNLPAPLSLTPEPLPFRPMSLGVSDEQKLELLEYWRSIQKRKWAILALGLVAALVAGAIAFALTPIYSATATLQIEAGKGKILSIEEVYAGGSQAREHYQTQVEILKSREVAERTVKALKLWEHPEFDPRKAGDGWLTQAKAAVGMGRAKPVWTEAELIQSAVKKLSGSISIEPVRLSQLVKVNVESPDRTLASQLANAVAVNYIENDRESRFAVSQQASGFLQDRLGALREQLGDSEKALQEYRQSKGIVSLAGSSQTLASQQVGGTNERLMAARSRRLELEAAYQQVNAIGNGDYAGVPWVMRDPSVAAAQAQYNDVQRRLAEMSQTLGAKNSRVLQAEAELESIGAALKTQRAAAVNGITREYQAARSTEASLEREMNNARSGVSAVNKEEFQLAVLEREVQTNRELYDMFMSRAKETNLAGDVQAAVARVVDRAVPPEVPVKPAKRQIVVVALVLALFIGALISLLLDKLDNTVKGGDDAETRLRLPLLTSLPMLDSHSHEQMARLFIDEPNSHHAEAIRTARTGVLLSNIDRSHKTLLVTSTIPGEGKTTLAINLALAHAQTKRTLLIDADMRRPQVGRRLGLAPETKGLSNLVSGQAELAACIHTVADSPLLVMPVGDLPPNPLELLLSERFKEALKALSEQFDIVIVDSPPVELVSEALVLAPLCTSTILVVKAMSTPTPMVRKSITRLQRAGASMLGVVLNHLDFSKAQRYHGQYGGGYSYGEGYGYTGAPGYGYAPQIEAKKATTV